MVASRSRAAQQAPSDLTGLLAVIERVADEDSKVSLRDLYRAVGRRSFGPLLLLAGLIVLMPVVGDVPGVPTVMGTIVVLIAVQLLARRDHFWLPRVVLERSIRAERVRKGVHWLRKPARWVDRLLRPRLTRFVSGAWTYAVAGIALLVGLATPFMELVPFSANGAGAVLTALGLALISHDGLVALIAMALAILTSAAVIYALAA